jgi:hypothetical protein
MARAHKNNGHLAVVHRARRRGKKRTTWTHLNDGGVEEGQRTTTAKVVTRLTRRHHMSARAGLKEEVDQGMTLPPGQLDFYFTPTSAALGAHPFLPSRRNILG